MRVTNWRRFAGRGGVSERLRLTCGETEHPHGGSERLTYEVGGEQQKPDENIALPNPIVQLRVKLAEPAAAICAENALADEIDNGWEQKQPEHKAAQ